MRTDCGGWGRGFAPTDQGSALGLGRLPVLPAASFGLGRKIHVSFLTTNFSVLISFLGFVVFVDNSF